MRKLVLIIFIQLSFFLSWSQSLSNTIKGKIIDAQSGSALPGVNILLLGSEPLRGVQSDGDGVFRLLQVPLGRQTLRVTSMGYGEQMIPNILVTSGKEVNLEVRLVERVFNADEVKIKARRNEDLLNNEFGTLSARSF